MGKRPPGKGFIGVAALVGLALVGLVAFFFQSRSSGTGQESSSVSTSPSRAPGYAGTSSCRECHEKFYKLWAPSHHGLAMQPYTPAFATQHLTPPTQDIIIEQHRYRADIGDKAGWVVEQGPEGKKKFPIAHVMGGKNVYYFLTPLDRGRLQVLPVAYDVRQKEWYNTTASMVRHFVDHREAPVDWRDPLLTFNTACYSCHVSQLSTNYNLKTDTYHSVWAEPGINCETCHGPGAEHVRVCQEAPKGTVPEDLKIIRGGKQFTVAQNNATCSSCHAKASPLTPFFAVGARFFDHYDLVTLESPDFYPDGRDLGENYTYTSWRLSPCVQSGLLSCLHCHTTSGRYRFKDEAKANQACLPCHKERVDHPQAHIHHPLDKPGTPTKCISCHMPMTEFARMRRSDHSMLPPTPAATLRFKSPNACNLCHTDKEAAWADQQVRQWRQRDYQAPVLHRAGLVDAARQRDWTKLPEMLAYITSKERDEIFATSLIRLLAFCPDPQKWPVLRQALQDPSPLVRAAAVAGLGGNLSPENLKALLRATEDDYRLVRLRAAGALAPYPQNLLSTADQRRLDQATQELLASLMSRPDDWSFHYNLGNYYLDRGEFKEALAAFATASRLRPDVVQPWVNASMVYARRGDNQAAEQALSQALQIEPANATANYNLGLLLAEQGKTAEAEQALRAALKSNPELPAAAYNLGVLLSRKGDKEGLEWLGKAGRLRPEPRYLYTLAFFQLQQGNGARAAKVLQNLTKKHPAFPDAYLLLGEIFEKAGKTSAALDIYRQALDRASLNRRQRLLAAGKVKSLAGPPKQEP
jgi:Tfp pilus assembly protein PilF